MTSKKYLVCPFFVFLPEGLPDPTKARPKQPLGLPFGSLWLPFGSLLGPLGFLLGSLGSFFAPFGLPFAPLWCPLGHFCSPQGSIFALSGYLGSIVGILLYVHHFCSPRGFVFALSGYLGSIVSIVFKSNISNTSLPPSLKPSPQMSSPSKGVAKGQEGQGHRARAKANGQPEIVVGWWVFHFVRPAGLIEQMVNCPLG